VGVGLVVGVWVWVWLWVRVLQMNRRKMMSNDALTCR